MNNDQRLKYMLGKAEALQELITRVRAEIKLIDAEIESIQSQDDAARVELETRMRVAGCATGVCDE